MFFDDVSNPNNKPNNKSNVSPLGYLQTKNHLRGQIVNLALMAHIHETQAKQETAEKPLVSFFLNKVMLV